MSDRMSRESEIQAEWNNLFCRCGWNLKGIAPNRHCTHCEYVENPNQQAEIEAALGITRLPKETMTNV